MKRRVLVAGRRAGRAGGRAGLRRARPRRTALRGSQGGSADRCCWRRRQAGAVNSRGSSSGEPANWNGSTSRCASTVPRRAGHDFPESDADVVIVATGGVPDLNWIEGAEHCTSVLDILSGAASVGEDSIVYDGTGRHAALTAAEAIRQAGGEVAFFGLDGHLAMEMSYAEQVIWRRRTYELGIVLRLDRRLERVEREGNRLRVTFRNELTDEAEEHETGRIVVEHGTRPADALFHGPGGSRLEPWRRRSAGSACGRAAAGKQERRLRALPHRRRGL